MPGRVIEHQQIFLPASVVPPPRRPRLQPGRDLRRGHPGGQQQAGQRIGRVDRPLPGGMGVQRQEELPVREAAGQPVRGVHREGGLADPGHPADRVNPHHPAARGRLRPPRHQLAELGLAAGEGGDIPRQRPGGRRRGRPRRSRRGRQHLAGRRPAAGRRHEQLARRPGQAQRTGQQQRGVLAGGAVDAPLQVADRPRAQPAPPRPAPPGSARPRPAAAAAARRTPAQPAPLPAHRPPALVPSARPAPAPTRYQRQHGLTAQRNPVPLLWSPCARLRMVTARPGR